MSSNGTGPKFDFSRVSRKWGKRWAASVTRVTEIQVELHEIAPPAPDASPEAQTAYARQQVNLIREMQQNAAEQERLLAQVLVEVPRAWLTEDAPESLDWHDPESLDYVLEQYSAELLNALTEARAQSSKN